jgi:DNA-cytosine methyltransferase
MMVVVSLFDGISIAMSSLIRLGIKPTKYYASEVDPYAISISKYNFPDIIRLGDVTRITGDEIKEPVDLLIGGSPCQGFSFAGNMLQFNDPRSRLFFEYLRLKKILKPKHFLLENVKMPKRSSQVISEMLEVDFTEINSNLLSAQNRRRLYWSNLKITQPKPQGLLLKDIIQDGKVGYNYTNEPNFMERYNSEATGIGANQQQLMNVHPSGRGMNGWVYSTNGASPTVTTNKGEGSKIYVEEGHRVDDKYFLSPKMKDYVSDPTRLKKKYTAISDGNDKSLPLTTLTARGLGTSIKVPDKYYLSQKMKDYILADKFDNKGKSNLNPEVAKPLTANYSKGLRARIGTYLSGNYIPEGKTNIRRVTPIEAERLQTLPDDYTASGTDKNGNQVKISDSRRYFALGNGFTADVISWILSPLLKDNPDMNNKHSKQLGLF